MIAVLIVNPTDVAPWSELARSLSTCRVLVCGEPPGTAAHEFGLVESLEFFDGPCDAPAIVGAVQRMMPVDVNV